MGGGNGKEVTRVPDIHVAREFSLVRTAVVVLLSVGWNSGLGLVV